jgi:hypothetical protein
MVEEEEGEEDQLAEGFPLLPLLYVFVAIFPSIIIIINNWTNIVASCFQSSYGSSSSSCTCSSSGKFSSSSSTCMLRVILIDPHISLIMDCYI